MRLSSVACAAAVAAGACAVAGGHAAPTQSFAPAGLGLTLSLPSSWTGANRGTTAADVRFSATAPSSVATLAIYAGTTTSFLSVREPKFKDQLRQSYTSQYPNASLETQDTRVGSMPALRLIARYHGSWKHRIGEITHAIYLVIYRSTLYAFDYTTIAPHTSTYLPIFSASARSIHFSQPVSHLRVQLAPNALYKKLLAAPIPPAQLPARLQVTTVSPTSFTDLMVLHHALGSLTVNLGTTVAVQYTVFPTHQDALNQYRDETDRDDALAISHQAGSPSLPNPSQLMNVRFGFGKTINGITVALFVDGNVVVKATAASKLTSNPIPWNSLMSTATVVASFALEHLQSVRS